MNPKKKKKKTDFDALKGGDGGGINVANKLNTFDCSASFNQFMTKHVWRMNDTNQSKKKSERRRRRTSSGATHEFFPHFYSYRLKQKHRDRKRAYQVICFVIGRLVRIAAQKQPSIGLL